MAQIGRGRKDPKRTSGAPFPPATQHSDGPEDRPRRDVPPAEELSDDESEHESTEEGAD
jgi:hypothetical protein